MPERFPDSSPDNVILALKLVLDRLELPYETGMQCRRIQHIMGELRAAGIINLGHRIYPTANGTWYSTEVRLDLDLIRCRDRVGYPINHDRTEQLRQCLLNALDRFKVERLPSIPL